MIQYIYFVKCPNCEDELFDFFDDAKEYAIGCLSNKPIITQTEVCRNDFGECTNHSDLGTVWSWEDMMKDTDTEQVASVFNKDGLRLIADVEDPEFDVIDNSVDCEIEEISDSTPISENAARNGGFRTTGYRTALACYDSDDFDINVELGMQDEEEYEVKDQLYLLRPGQTVADLVVYLSRECGFTNIYVYGETGATRNDIRTATRFTTVPGVHDYRHYGTLEDRLVEKCDKKDRKPIPEGMTIEQLVEEMEENEDMVECTWCEELFDRSMCRREVDLGWLCSRCEAAIKSRGETLTFREGPMYEAFNRTHIVNGFDYDRPIEFEYYLTVDLSDETDDGRPAYYSDDFTYTVDAVDVAVELVEDFLTDEEVIAAGVEDGLEGLEADDVFEKFFAQHLDALVDKYHDQLLAYYKERAQEEFEESVSIGDYYDLQYGKWVDSQIDAYRDSRLEELTKDTSLDKLEESADYRERLTPCPECGDKSYDCETGFCISCGFN